MCLRNPVKLHDKEPITVYKVFGVSVTNGALESPVTKSKYFELGKKLYAVDNAQNQHISNISMFLNHFSFTYDLFYTNQVIKESENFHGAFHSFKEIEHCKCWAKLHNIFLHYDKYVICKCTIPSDTEYAYSGIVHSNDYAEYPGYASESIIIDEIVYEEEYK